MPTIGADRSASVIFCAGSHAPAARALAGRQHAIEATMVTTADDRFTLTQRLSAAARACAPARGHLVALERGGNAEPHRCGRLALAEQLGRRAVVELRVRQREPVVGAAGAVGRCDEPSGRVEVAQAPGHVGGGLLLAARVAADVRRAHSDGVGDETRAERHLEPLREVVDALAVALPLVSVVFEGHARVSPVGANLAPPASDFAEVVKTPPTGASSLSSEPRVQTLILELTPLMPN